MPAPTGTVTFLFTDIEGSTKLWEQQPQAMRAALARHNVLLHQAIAAHDGLVFKTVGDAFCSAFASTPQALNAALTAQQSMVAEPWPPEARLSVRMALHTGLADEREGDYFGPPLNRVARLLSVGHGGQTLLSLPAYELTRDALPNQCSLRDLGIHALRDLARPEQVFQLLHPDLRGEFPPLKSLDSLPNNLPQQMTSFIGREKELTRVKDLLAKTRLLTLTGSGGCGKTRLSLQAAADVLDTYPDGVWLVELAPITDPSLVPQAVASVLGIKDQPGQTLTQTLADWLKSKTLLLLLDNCEHLLSACAAFVSDILRQCPTVRILASSREGLNVTGEQTYRVPSLSLPDAKVASTPENLSQYEAVRLFIDREMQVKPDFTVTNQNAPAVASVCHRVDGIPLALELAAARVRSLSVDEINDRLDNRFRLLVGGNRDGLPRHQTLRALIDWSYDLLTEQEKSLWRHLSVFSAGWTLKAAEAVCVGEDIETRETLDLLSSLVDKSIVSVEEIIGQIRYHLLETIRQYGRDKLSLSNEDVLMRERHRDYYLQLAEEAAPKLSGLEQALWLTVLETEHDNLRQALTFCLEQSEGEEMDATEKGLRLGGALEGFWMTRGHLSEGRERLTALLSRPKAQSHTKMRGDVLNSAGSLASMQGDYAVARSHFEESLGIGRELKDKKCIASSLFNLGKLAQRQGNYEAACSNYEKSMTIRGQLEDRIGIADCLTNLGIVAFDQGNYGKAQSLFEESLTIFRGLKQREGIAISLTSLGSVALNQGDYRKAQSLFEESLPIHQELKNKQGIAITLRNQGILAHKQGNNAIARPLLESSLAIQRELVNMRGITTSLEAFATLTFQEEKAERAACLFGAAQALREVIGSPLPPSEREEYDRQVATARASLGLEAFATAWAEGQAMTWEMAVDEALAG